MLIAASDLLPVLRPRVAGWAIELLVFADSDVRRALETIMERRPRIVALERQFAATSRGTALVERLAADPTLSGCQVRIVAPDGAFTLAAPPQRTGGERPAGGAGPTAAASAAALAPTAAGALDRRGTRRAARVLMQSRVEVLVDGNAALLVNLSPIGAQVVSQTVLKPNQRVRMALPDDLGSVRFNAQIAWASYEIPQNASPRYRAGVEFVDADPAAVSAFCLRHQQN